MIHNILWLLVEAGTSLFEIILIQTFLNGFLEEKELSRTSKIIALTGSFALIFIVSTCLYSIPTLVSINFFVVTIILSFIQFKGKLVHRLFSCILLLALLLVMEIISVFLLVLVLDFDPNIIQSNPMIKFAGIVIKNVMSLAAIKIICNLKKTNVREAGILYTVSLFIVPVISVIISIILFHLVLRYEITDAAMILTAYLGLMYINAIVFGIFESILRHLDKEYKYKMIEKQLELQVSHYSKLAETRETLFEVIHDFKNHLNCIYNLYKYNKGKELGKYIENLISITDSENVVDTGNPVIDALLNDKTNIAQRLGINFNKVLNLPSGINIAHNDICAILGNSLDNAIEACKRIENKSLMKEIELSMNYRDSYLIIVVTNTFDQPPLKEGRFFRSSKVTPGLHGLGMQSIERTVKKYNGNMVIKCDKSLFALEIVMSTA